MWLFMLSLPVNLSKSDILKLADAWFQAGHQVMVDSPLVALPSFIHRNGILEVSTVGEMLPFINHSEAYTKEYMCLRFNMKAHAWLTKKLHKIIKQL